MRWKCANCGFVFEAETKTLCPRCGSNAVDPVYGRIIW